MSERKLVIPSHIHNDNIDRLIRLNNVKNELTNDYIIIYVDDDTIDLKSLGLDSYEVIEITKCQYEQNKKYIQSLASQNKEKYDTIESLKEEIINIKDELDKVKQEKLDTYIDKHKVYLNAYIKNKVNTYIKHFMKHFNDNVCTYEDLSNIYKSKIDAEFKLRIENYKKYLITSILSSFNYIDIDKLQIIVNGSYEEDYDYGIDKLVHDFKNKFVDSFTDLFAKRGNMQYHYVMHKAGKLADLLEHALWEYYALGEKRVPKADVESMNKKWDDIIDTYASYLNEIL